MSNFQEYKVGFNDLIALIQAADSYRLNCAITPYDDDKRTSNMMYETETLENIVGEMRCLINEVNKRVCYLKNTINDDIGWFS